MKIQTNYVYSYGNAPLIGAARGTGRSRHGAGTRLAIDSDPESADSFEATCCRHFPSRGRHADKQTAAEKDDAQQHVEDPRPAPAQNHDEQCGRRLFMNQS